MTEAQHQLDAYFDRARREFQLPLAPRGSEFQQAVWAQICAIPYGATTPYGDVARRLASAAALSLAAASISNPTSQ